MGIFDRFKTKQAAKADQTKPAGVSDEKKTESKPFKEDTGVSHRILYNYHLSEKSNLLSGQGRYVFKVSRKANKIEVKQAVEKVYDVHVVAVNILNNKSKSRRTGRIVGLTSPWKKAYVTLKAGEKISGLAEGV